MPINTDALDLKQPLAGQDLSAAKAPPLDNPVLSSDRLKAMGDLFRKEHPVASQPGQSVTPPLPAKPAAPVVDDLPTTRQSSRALTEPASAPVAAAPATASTPPTDAPAAPAIDPSATMSPRSREHFKRIEEARDAFKTQATEAKRQVEELAAKIKPLEEELAKLKTTPAVPELDELRTKATRAEQLEAENKQLLERLETINLEHSPRFQNWWKTETEKHVKLAQRNVPADKREELGKLLLEPASTERDAAIDAIIEPLGKTAQRLINGAIEQLEMVKQTREDSLAQGSERYKQLMAKEAEERTAAQRQSQAALDRITQAALNRASALEAFKPIDGNTEHNEAINARREFVKALVAGKVDEDVAVAIPGLAFEALHLRDTVVPALRRDLDAANAIIKQLQSAGPAPANATAPASNAPARRSTPGAPPMPGTVRGQGEPKFLTALREAMS